MSIYKFEEFEPEIHLSAYVADSASVIGQVILAEDTSIWSNAVLRGDNEPITIGKGSNVQEGAVLHNDHGFPIVVGENVTIGHQATLHGCTIGDGSLIGIHAILLNGAVIGKNSLVAAGALVTEGKVFPDRSLIVGVPGKVLRVLTEEEIAGNLTNAYEYVRKGVQYKSASLVVRTNESV
jgi:carbonic anhydrase/acetyltransferase-like protein (isoleucine patch superfamily)